MITDEINTEAGSPERIAEVDEVLGPLRRVLIEAASWKHGHFLTAGPDGQLRPDAMLVLWKLPRPKNAPPSTPNAQP